jgi:hypothetical protein
MSKQKKRPQLNESEHPDSLDKNDLKNVIDTHDATHSAIYDTTHVWCTSLLDCFITSTYQVWKSMHDNHIKPIKQFHGIDLLDVKNTKLTYYIDYAKKIRSSTIRLPPDWFILSNGSASGSGSSEFSQQRLIPCYAPEIDPMGFALINKYSTKGKTMIMMHFSETMTRNGMHVSDIITRSLFKIFGNMFCLNYLREISTSPEWCFTIRNHYMALYEHLKFGLLEENLTNIILISPRHIIMIVKFLKEMRSQLVDELMALNYKRGKYVHQLLFDEKYYSMRRIFEKLWPKLGMIVMMRQGGFRVHAEYIRKYIGNIKIYCPVYALPEITIGYDYYNDNTYTIDPRKGYFEAIPVSKHNNNLTVKNIRNLKIGELYNLVVSTSATDMHRYVTNEIVRIIGYTNGSPKIDIMCKENEIIRSNDRIITPYDLELILMKHFSLIDYTIILPKKSNESNESEKIKLYIELDESHYTKDATTFYDVKNNIKEIKILKFLSEKLEISMDVKVVVPGTFHILYQSRYNDNTDPALIQIPRIITDCFDLEIIRENILYVFT